MTSPAKMLDRPIVSLSLVTSLFFLGRLIVNFAGSKRKVPTISRETHAKVSYQNFDDEKKNCKREEVEIDGPTRCGVLMH